jgi:hypothetical protein
MWISRAVYTDLRESVVAAQAIRDSQIANISALNTTVDWFRVRITQLEHERALMLQNYMGITVPHMSIERAPKAGAARPSYDPVPHFDDVGDDEAKRIGVDWNPETGEINYNEITNG